MDVDAIKQTTSLLISDISFQPVMEDFFVVLAICHTMDAIKQTTSLLISDISFQPVMEDFFVVLAICHTVRLDYGFDQSSPPRKDKKKGRRSSKTSLRTEYSSRLIQTGDKFVYQASSPDEKALIEACRR